MGDPWSRVPGRRERDEGLALSVFGELLEVGDGLVEERGVFADRTNERELAGQGQACLRENGLCARPEGIEALFDLVRRADAEDVARVVDETVGIGVARTVAVGGGLEHRARRQLEESCASSRKSEAEADRDAAERRRRGGLGRAAERFRVLEEGLDQHRPPRRRMPRLLTSCHVG